MNNTVFSIFLFILGLIIGFVVVFIVNFLKKKSDNKKADSIIETAKKDADKIKRDSLFETKEEIHKLKIDADKEIKEKKSEIKEQEDRLLQRENNIDRRDLALQNRESSLDERENNLLVKQQKIQESKEEVEDIKRRELEELEKISKYTKEQARDAVMKMVEDKMSKEIATYIKEAEAEAKLNVDEKSKELLVGAMQKYAADITSEQTVSVINLPNDEMKGRIIGREGRNIRTLETLTGIDLIIDDTPEAVILSGFDPIRREVARIALEKLIADGRIHPARIEEMVDKARKEVENIIKEYGEQAAFETGVHGLHPELVKLLGRLNYRTSYGQNVLKHSIEVAHIAGIMAAEIGADIRLAKRAGLLHDIGKAVDHEMEGTHVEIGMDLLKRYKESKEVIHAMSTHHGDYEPQTIEAVLVTAADAISAARPGARRETLEAYIRRLEKLEEIANSYEGVDKSFAIQAGREIRIMVKPENVSDEDIHLLARDMTKRIEDELEYPGQIKVSIIRETRAIEYAK